MTLRTLAALAAFPLALAFSGCVDEGLELGYEPLEAIGPELPEGVSAGPAGSIVIEKGLAAPEGFTGGVLDEEGWEALARLTGFTCSSIWQCYSKCPWDALCICRWNGSVWECEVIYPEDFCKWFDCEGTGEGGDWKKQVSLDCGLPVTRGQVASCTVETGNGLNRNLLTSHWFAWKMGTSKSGGLEWGGTATETTEIEVVLTMAVVGETVNLRETVQVRPRIWGLRTQHARLQWADPIPDFPKAWGYYARGEPSPVTLDGTAQGSGPWKGRYILSGGPAITAAAMYAHNDLKSGGRSYPLLYTLCGQPPGFVSVHFLNDACGWEDRVDDFRDWVVAHERRHQESLNECIRAVNADGRLAAVEAIVGNDPGEALRKATTLWTDGLVPALINAKTTAQQGDSTNFWHWRRYARWVYGGKTGDHTGTEGCPQI